MSQPSVRAEIDAIEAKITAGLQKDRTGQGWQLQLDGAQWGIVLEALRRYKAQALMPLESYPLRVEELSARGEIVQVMVYADHPMIARAAFRAVVEQYPKSRIRLRNRALIVSEQCASLAARAFRTVRSKSFRP